MHLASSLFVAMAHLCAPASSHDPATAGQHPADLAAADFAAELAAWELAAATDGDDAEVLARIEALAARAQAALAADPQLQPEVARVEAARARFRGARGLDAPIQPQGGAAPGRKPVPEDVILAQTVRAGLSSDDQTHLVTLGKLVVPHLAAVAREMTPETTNGVPARALRILAVIDVAATLDVIAELAEQQSVLVRSVLARTLELPLASHLARHMWITDERGTVRFQADHWNRITDRLLLEPAVDVKSLRQWIGAGTKWGYMPDSVVAAISKPGAEVEWPSPSPMHEGLRPVYEAGLAHEDSKVRAVSVRVLAGSLDPTPVYALAADRVAEVRDAVSRAVAPHNQLVWTEPDAASIAVPRVPEPTTKWRWALEQLLQDESESVRRRALAGAQALRTDGTALLDANELLELDRGIRDPELLVQLYDHVLQSHPASAPDVLRRAFFHAALQAESARAHLRTLVATVTTAPERYGVPEVKVALLEGLERAGSADLWGKALSSGPLPAWLRGLDDGGRVRALVALHGVDPLSAWDYSGGLPTGKDPEPWRAVQRDAALDPVLRLCAAVGAISATGGEEQVARSARSVLDAIAPFVVEPWPSVQMRVRAPERAGRMAARILKLTEALVANGQTSTALVLQLVRDPALPRTVLERITIPGKLSGEPAAELVRAVMGRFPDFLTTLNTEMLAVLVDASPALPPDERHGFWAEALAGHSWVQQAALRAIRASRDLGAIPLLREASTQEGINYHGFADTAAALGGNDAARLLLDLAASAPNRETRAAVMESLDQLLALQEAEARWQRRQDAAVLRERAIAELVALLDSETASDEQRVESVRGLALLQAVEELPRLVRLLSSPSARLAQAARESLARLNQPADDGPEKR